MALDSFHKLLNFMWLAILIQILSVCEVVATKCDHSPALLDLVRSYPVFNPVCI